MFPGGSVERSDRDTALREAHEETGLDPGSVEILGHLSERSTPDARFVVTPVLAWSRHLRFTAPVSPGEVTGMGLVGLATLSRLRAGNHGALRRIAGEGPRHYPKSALSGVLPPMTAAVVRELVGIVSAVGAIRATPLRAGIARTRRTGKHRGLSRPIGEAHCLDDRPCHARIRSRPQHRFSSPDGCPGRPNARRWTY